MLDKTHTPWRSMRMSGTARRRRDNAPQGTWSRVGRHIAATARKRTRHGACPVVSVPQDDIGTDPLCFSLPGSRLPRTAAHPSGVRTKPRSRCESPSWLCRRRKSPSGQEAVQAALAGSRVFNLQHGGGVAASGLGFDLYLPYMLRSVVAGTRSHLSGSPCFSTNPFSDGDETA